MERKKNLRDINLTKSQIKSEIDREKYKSKYRVLLKNTIYSLIILFAVATILTFLFLPVLQISGSSMTPKYNNNDIVVALRTSKIKKGDIVALYQGNKILVKRVIATQGDKVKIDDDGNVFINGDKLNEEYVSNKQIGEYTIKFPYEVPDNSYFVLSDNRKNYNDSRNEKIGSIKSDDIVGKIIFRVWSAK